MSTDCNLSASEIVRIYGNRWSIECFFKASKSYMKLGTEFQCRSYTAMVSHTAIVFTRYMILEWIRRNENDSKTFGELYFNLCDDIQDMDFVQALQSLMALFVEQLNTFTADITTIIKSKLSLQIKSQEKTAKILNKIFAVSRRKKRPPPNAGLVIYGCVLFLLR